MGTLLNRREIIMCYRAINPAEDAQKQIDFYREEFSVLHYKIQNSIGISRELSLCFTKLEEASMWLNKAISRDLGKAVAQNEENQNGKTND